ncbi:MAG: hypothetical protein PHS73_03335 [Candidatus Peribacteraceae bacterium]|nr:hypothetical protein [Candidatus Peribacteraceae bacterium]
MEKLCIQCHAPFEITDADLAFYDKISPVFGKKKYPIPPPTHCPDCRLQRRLAWRNPRKLWQRTCAKCGGKIQTTYSPEQPETVYCEECYLKEVY